MNYYNIDDVVGKMSDDEFKTLIENVLRTTKRQMEREKLSSLLTGKVQNDNR